MGAAFYAAAAIAIFATAMTITRLNVVHALLYLTVSLLAVAVVFYILGAPFIAALEVIIYAGAIMVLFVFVVMLLDLGERAARAERRRRSERAWLAPGILSGVLLAEFVDLVIRRGRMTTVIATVDPKRVGAALLGPYFLGLELASTLLLAGLIGAYHIGRRTAGGAKEMQRDRTTDERRIAAGGDLVHARPGRRHDAP